ncbi:F-box/FBD/LRR-repeat protein At5g44980 isoform X1 [Lolium perenne]|uniref:F-box/FBD/LRR-repeat protein At5g44980 isoform X1 n=1 Tax=Lolium perenne TaxID=4522 RepID=UPI0021E9EE06|nr:F-box/FBD/LRR-repeat protein At5g44980-like [Lolium perenne]
MEAVAAAASAAAAAAKDLAAAAAKDAAAAAATAKEKKAAAKEAAVAASTAELNAEQAAARASALALDAKEAAAVAAAATAAAAAQASRKRKFHLVDDQVPSDGDFISRLPDHLLDTIVLRIPTKERVRTQAFSRRWRPLWRSTPLDLVADYDLKSKGRKTVDLIHKIISQHPGPARRFSFRLSITDCYHELVGWIGSRALDNLQELELDYTHTHSSNDRKKMYMWQLPSAVFRFAPTLRVAKFYNCIFPDFIVQLALKFPRLKQLTLDRVTMSEDALQSLLSGCTLLESLELRDNLGIVRLCISSQTLKSLGFSANSRNKCVLLQELVVEDAPSLERLLPLDPKYGPATIRIISAPKLKILGILSEDISELQFGNTVFQKMIVVGLATKMHTVRVLALGSAGPNQDTVANFLKCFPNLERLYVIFQPSMDKDDVLKYDPIECLELHLKVVVLKNYNSITGSSISFAKFFILNAKVLKEMKISLVYHRQQNWFANQRRLLQIENRASQDARIELTCGRGSRDNFTHNRHTHDLSMADPFDIPSGECYDCMELIRKKSLLF